MIEVIAVNISEEKGVVKHVVDEVLLNEAFKKLVRELYNMRSEFVHNAKYVAITVPEEDSITMIFDSYKKRGKYFCYVSDVKYKDFEMLVIKATIKYLMNKHKDSLL